MTKIRPSKADLPERLASAIRQTWPDGVVDLPANADGALFSDTYPKLKASLSSIPGSAVFYEREPRSSSYCLVFLSPADERFLFETDTLEPDDEGVEQRFRGEGRIGCVVGVSIVASFALVALDEMEVFENGSRMEPDVEPHIFGLGGRKLDLEEHYRQMVDDDGVAVLRKLRAGIVRVLKEFDIAVIPEKDLDRRVPWLRAGEKVFVGHTGEPITVRQAFFFQGPQVNE